MTFNTELVFESLPKVLTQSILTKADLQLIPNILDWIQVCNSELETVEDVKKALVVIFELEVFRSSRKLHFDKISPLPHHLVNSAALFSRFLSLEVMPNYQEQEDEYI